MGRVAIELIIFDCDGTLVDSEPLSNGVLAEQLTELGRPTTTEEAMELFMGRSMLSALATMREELGVRLPEDFLPTYRKRMYAAFEAELEVIPGVREALDALPHRKCVASSASREKTRFSLTHTGLLHHFGDDLFSARQVENGKPAPDLFLFAARQLRVAPASCLVVEDSLPGVQAGVAAGMRTLAFAHRVEAQTLERAGGTVFTEMATLPKLIAAG
jgi:HAD superfamily hydrolase (TIGR01509 family)